MKIVCLLGSPRPKGNSAAIAARFCEAAEGLGAEVTTFALNKLKYRGCQACMTCKTKLDKCVLKEDRRLNWEGILGCLVISCTRAHEFAAQRSVRSYSWLHQPQMEFGNLPSRASHQQQAKSLRQCG